MPCWHPYCEGFPFDFQAPLPESLPASGGISYGVIRDDESGGLGVEFQRNDVLNFEVTFDGLHGPWEDSLVYYAQVRGERLTEFRFRDIAGLSDSDDDVDDFFGTTAEGEFGMSVYMQDDFFVYNCEAPVGSYVFLMPS